MTDANTGNGRPITSKWRAPAVTVGTTRAANGEKVGLGEPADSELQVHWVALDVGDNDLVFLDAVTDLKYDTGNRQATVTITFPVRSFATVHQNARVEAERPGPGLEWANPVSRETPE